jgi:hypothetical protein
VLLEWWPGHGASKDIRAETPVFAG